MASAATSIRRRVGGRPQRPATGTVTFVPNAAEAARLKSLNTQAKTANTTAKANQNNTGTTTTTTGGKQPFLQHRQQRNTNQHQRPAGKPDDPADDIVIVLRGVQRLDRPEVAAEVLNEIKNVSKRVIPQATPTQIHKVEEIRQADRQAETKKRRKGQDQNQS